VTSHRRIRIPFSPVVRATNCRRFRLALGVSLGDSIRITPWLEAVSLGLRGFVAGRRAGFVGWRLLVVALAGLLVGLVVLLIQVGLQPGQAISGGVAMG
jgi:hypothetical protein